MNMEQNKIFAALLVAGITAYFAGFISDLSFHQDMPERNAYYIDVPEKDSALSTESTAPAGPEPILELIAAADVTKGQKLSRACAACHSFDQGGKDGIGPNLWDIFEAQKASKPGFAYSDALKEKGGTWTVEDLNAFLWKPKKFAPGTKMNYIGMKKVSDRAAIVAWLKTLK